MANPGCTETMETFAGIGIAGCTAIVGAFVYAFWVLWARPLIRDWLDARRQR